MSDLFSKLTQEDVDALGELLQKTIKTGMQFNQQDARAKQYTDSAERIQKILADIEKQKGLKPVKPQPPQQPETLQENFQKRLSGN